MARHRKKYEKKNIEAAKIALSGMTKSAADANSVHTKQAVGMLKKEIQAARRGGATWAEVMEALHTAGVEVSTRTVMEMVNTGKKKAAVSTPAKASTKPQTKTVGSVPPPITAGGFQIRPDRGADL